MPTIVIASPSDWERVRRIRLAALQDTPDAFGSTFEDEVQRPPEWWIDRLQPLGSVTLLALEPSESGMVVLGSSRSAPDGSRGIFGVWVAPEHRGKGIGDALLCAAIAQARSQGVGRLVLDVGRDNLPARRLYLRHGFLPTGIESTLPPPRTHIIDDQLELILEVASVAP